MLTYSGPIADALTPSGCLRRPAGRTSTVGTLARFMELQPDDPTVFATAFIYFSGHQRINRGRADRRLEQLRREPYVRHELPMIGRAVKNISF
jgi:hypothetical protein